MLFLLGIDSLLRYLQKADTGLSINGIYTRSLGHADDLRGVIPSLTCANKQARIVEAFTVEYFLKLNLDKLEILPMYEGSNISPGNEPLQVGSLSITPSTSSKCRCVMWSSNLSPKASIDLNIKKARRASMGIHQGMLNPLTCTQIYEACVVSVCLYGSENWIHTEQLLVSLEKFQAEIGKRILNLPKQHSNLTHLITMRWLLM